MGLGEVAVVNMNKILSMKFSKHFKKYSCGFRRDRAGVSLLSQSGTDQETFAHEPGL